MDIENNELLSRFEVSVDGGIGLLNYRIEAGVMFLQYVEVPPESQGRGIAGDLSRAALEFAGQRGLKVVPSCSYVAAYIDQHPEYLGIVQR